MKKKVYIQRRVENYETWTDFYYVGEFENQSGLKNLISIVSLGDQSSDWDNLTVAEDSDAMLSCDYAVFLYDDLQARSLSISLSKVKAEKILHKDLNYVKLLIVEGKRLSSVFSSHQERIVF
jgi:hypothetical protein